MIKRIINELIDHPFLTSIFVSDLVILLFHRPPFLFSALMISLLMVLSMYFGQKMALFKK